MNWAPALIGIGLITVEVLRSVPALRQLRRSRSIDGVSPASLGFLCGAAGGWLSVGVLSGQWWMFAASAVWTVFHFWICWTVWRISADAGRRIVRVGLLSAVGFGVAAAALSSFVPWVDAIGYVIAAGTLAEAVPALVAGMRSVTTAGLSWLALAVTTVEGVVYVVVGAGDQPVIGYLWYGVIIIATTGPRLGRVLWRRVRKLP